MLKDAFFEFAKNSVTVANRELTQWFSRLLAEIYNDFIALFSIKTHQSSEILWLIRRIEYTVVHLHNYLFN